MTDREDISQEQRPWFGSWPAHLPKHLTYPNVPAWWILERNLERFADKDAVLFLHHENLAELDRLTYRDLWERANALAAGLCELGVRPGDRVGTLLPNCPAIITSYYGIWMAGAAVTPCNALASEKEFTHQLRDAGAKILIAAETMAGMAMSAAESLGLRVILAPVGETVAAIPAGAIRFAELIRTGRKRPADVVVDPRADMAVLLYTGGTTGDPKGAVLTHRNIVANTMQFAEWYALEAGKEVFVCTIPMSHSGGMSGVMNVPLYGGATLVVLRRFLAERRCQGHRAIPGHTLFRRADHVRRAPRKRSGKGLRHDVPQGLPDQCRAAAGRRQERVRPAHRQGGSHRGVRPHGDEPLDPCKPHRKAQRPARSAFRSRTRTRR